MQISDEYKSPIRESAVSVPSCVCSHLAASSSKASTAACSTGWLRQGHRERRVLLEGVSHPLGHERVEELVQVEHEGYGN
eukprot:1079370-Prymnesium_polylepis.2